MKIDLHTHILPREWPDLDAKYGYAGFVRLDHYKPCCARMMIGDRVFREITDNVWDPKRRIEEMDREKISMQVLSTVPVMFSYWAKPHDALDLSRRLNDHIADVVRDHPKRFAGLATIPLQDPDLAAQELERCVRKLGLRGAQIGTHVDANPHSGRIDTLNLDNASLQPVWNTAEQLGAAIFVHPWDMFGKERMPKYWLPWLVGMPAETSLAICSMMFGGSHSGRTIHSRWAKRTRANLSNQWKNSLRKIKRDCFPGPHANSLGWIPRTKSTEVTKLDNGRSPQPQPSPKVDIAGAEALGISVIALTDAAKLDPAVRSGFGK